MFVVKKCGAGCLGISIIDIIHDMVYNNAMCLASQKSGQNSEYLSSNYGNYL